MTTTKKFNGYTKRIFIVLGVTTTLLLIPLMAMQYTSEVHWTLFDFLIMGSLLTTVGLIVDALWHSIQKKQRVILFIVVTFLMFFFLWAELAVGVLGSPLAGS